MRLTVALIASASIAAGQAPAAPAPISANRPGFNESTAILEHGQLQVEMGGSMDEFSPVSRVWSGPYLVRVGLSDRFEFRVRGLTMGKTGLTYGGAYRRTAGAGPRPAVTFVGYVTPSTRSASVYIPLSWTTPTGVGVSIMPGGTVDSLGSPIAPVGALAGALSIPLADRLSLFGEVAGESLKPAGSVVTAGGGAAFRITLRDQLDVAFSRGVSLSGPRLRLAVGWSRRIFD